MKSLFKPASAARTQAIPDRSSPDRAVAVRAAGAPPAQVPDAADENAALLADTWLSPRKMHWVPLVVPLMAVMVLVSGMVVLSDI